MSVKTSAISQKATTFSYRNIKKDFVKPSSSELITKQFHLELGENNEAAVVEDRPVDWCERADASVDQVGLANILELARRTGEDLSQYAYKDEEAIDLGELNPQDPEAIKRTLAGKSEAESKLASIAAQLGVSSDELVDAFIKGSLSELISEKTKVEEKEEK